MPVVLNILMYRFLKLNYDIVYFVFTSIQAQYQYLTNRQTHMKHCLFGFLHQYNTLDINSNNVFSILQSLPKSYIEICHHHGIFQQRLIKHPPALQNSLHSVRYTSRLKTPIYVTLRSHLYPLSTSHDVEPKPPVPSSSSSEAATMMMTKEKPPHYW